MPALAPLGVLVLTALAPAAAPAPATTAGAHYIVQATSDRRAPEGDKPKVIISLTAAVSGRRYFLRLKRTSPVRQPATGAECSDTALTVIGVRSSPSGAVAFPPQPGGPYALGAAHLCDGDYSGTVLEQKSGHGTRLVRRFTLSSPSLKLTTRPT